MPRESVEKARSAGALAAVGACAELQSDVPFASETASLGGGGYISTSAKEANEGRQVSKASARARQGGTLPTTERRSWMRVILLSAVLTAVSTSRDLVDNTCTPQCNSSICYPPQGAPTCTICLPPSPRSRAGHCAMRRLRPRPAQSAVAAHSATHRRHRHVAFVTHLHLRLAASATHQARCVRSAIHVPRATSATCPPDRRAARRLRRCHHHSHQPYRRQPRRRRRLRGRLQCLHGHRSSFHPSLPHHQVNKSRRSWRW